MRVHLVCAVCVRLESLIATATNPRLFGFVREWSGAGLDLFTAPDWLQRPTRQTRPVLKRRGFWT